MKLVTFTGDQFFILLLNTIFTYKDYNGNLKEKDKYETNEDI